MSKHSIVHSLRKLLVASVALAGLSSAIVVSTPVPAEAKTCVQKYRDCNARCAGRSYEWQNCIYRTCNRQYDNCAGAGFSARKPMSPRDATATNAQQPSGSAKTPTRTDRPGKNGGFGERGPFRMSSHKKR
jgi:hypothetical protein